MGTDVAYSSGELERLSVVDDGTGDSNANGRNFVGFFHCFGFFLLLFLVRVAVEETEICFCLAVFWVVCFGFGFYFDSLLLSHFSVVCFRLWTWNSKTQPRLRQGFWGVLHILIEWLILKWLIWSGCGNKTRGFFFYKF